MGIITPGMSDMIKKILLFIAILAVSPLLVYAYLVYQNNRDIQPIDKQILQAHLEKSIQWLVDNESRILADDNSMLWWMLLQAGKRGGDPRLAMLLNKYLQQHASIKSGVWGPLFDGDRLAHIDTSSIIALPYYNQHFIYALHCAENLARDIEIIRQQNDAGFCYQPAYFFRPACATHQLMGINFLRQQACSNAEAASDVVRQLQHDIVRQLTWDVRVVDVYLQRAMMLSFTGAQDKVKPVWIRQILDHQLEDGGWADFVPLVPVGGGRSLGFSSQIVALGSATSSFHATAQGVYLLTIVGRE
jgi:hypothetical protein